MKRRRYKIADFEPHIKGSGGILSTIAARVGCNWITAKAFIEGNPTLAALYESECAVILDVAESVIYGNIQAAAKMQQDAAKTKQNIQVDSTDAKWILSRKGKKRGYGDESEISLKAPGGGIEIKTIRVHIPEEEATGDE